MFGPEKKHHERPWLAEFKNEVSMTSLRCLRTMWDQWISMVSDFPISPFKYANRYSRMLLDPAGKQL